MKPIIKIRLYSENGDKTDELETQLVKDIYQLLKVCDFSHGTLRATYEKDVFNEATFKSQTECKILLTLFREKPLLRYIYDGDL